MRVRRAAALGPCSVVIGDELRRAGIVLRDLPGVGNLGAGIGRQTAERWSTRRY